MAEGEPLPLLGAGDDFTCLLFPDRVTCFGKVPGSGNATSVTHAVQADLLQVGSRNYCVARRGEREVRCFGQMPFPGGELWNRWEAACRGDADCIEREFEAYTHAGLRLPTRGAVRDLAGLEERFCAVAGDELVCWDLTEEDPARRPVVARIAGAREVEMGSGMTCVLTTAGAVRCREDFGSADTGPFGPIANLPRVERIAVQGNWGCGWTADGEAHCWGVEVPPDGSELEERSAQRVPVLDGVQAASSNWNPRAVSCVLDGSGRTRCWGDDRYGQLGRPPRAGGAVTDPVEPPIEGARAIAVGAAHACAIDAGRVLRCWGRADRGALGARYARRSFGPVRVQGVRADALALYDDRSCARTAAGWVCWGRLPQDRVAEPWIPRAIDMPREATPTSFSTLPCRLSAGSLRCRRPDATELDVRVRVHAPGSSCLVRASGVIACRSDLRDVPGIEDVILFTRIGVLEAAAYTRSGEVMFFRESAVSGVRHQGSAFVGEGITHLAGGRRSCFRRSDGSVWCFSERRDGSPERRDLPPVDALVGGLHHACALARDGAVYCWGVGPDGELGVEGRPNDEHVRVPGLPRVVEIAAGDYHTCARTREGDVWCWGADADGQLGARPAWWRDGPLPIDLEALEQRSDPDR